MQHLLLGVRWSNRRTASWCRLRAAGVTPSSWQSMTNSSRWKPRPMDCIA